MIGHYLLARRTTCGLAGRVVLAVLPTGCARPIRRDLESNKGAQPIVGVSSRNDAEELLGERVRVYATVVSERKVAGIRAIRWQAPKR